MNAERLLAHYERIADAPDAIPRLRRFVLDLAVRGKLVPQDPNDEPVAALISSERIQGLYSEKTSEPIPLGSMLVNLGSLVTLKKGKKPTNLNNHGKGEPYLDIAALERGEIRQYSGDENCPRARPGDLVLVCDGSRSGLLLEGRDGILGSTLATVRFSGFERDYLRVLFRALYWDLNSAKKGAAIPHLNIPRLLSLKVLLPPITEQYRIVTKVNELMALCGRLEAANTEYEATRDRLTLASLARLNSPDPETFSGDARFALDALPVLTARADQIKQWRQTILNLAVRGKLVPQDWNDEPASEQLNRIAKEKRRLVKAREIKSDQLRSPVELGDEPFALPVSWKWCRLRELALALGDGLHGTPNYSESGDCYFINGNNLENGRIVFKPSTKTVSLDELKKHQKPLTSNSVLVSINGTLGKVAFYNGENIVLGKSACYFNLTKFTEKEFAKLVLDSPYFSDYAAKNATGTTIMNLSLKAMNEFPVPLPPLAEQRRIVAKVKELMALCGRLEASLTSGQDYSRRLLDALLAEALMPAEDIMPVEAAKVAAHG